MKIGDLVKMSTHDTGMVGIILDVCPRGAGRTAQVGIHWFGGSGKLDWEPQAWLEVVSEAKKM
tara:strand:- start:555 stop:743 length:189 start_codon:yes stop_codon:yes gene_type:complete